MSGFVARDPRPARPGRRRSSPRTRPPCCGATPSEFGDRVAIKFGDGSGRTPSTSRSRAGSPRCSLERLPADGPAPRRGAARQHARLPLRVRRRRADRRAPIVGLNHTRRDEHLLRDVEHTHCGLVITEPRHEALLAPIADRLPPMLVVDALRRRRRPDRRRSARRSPTRSPRTTARPTPASSPTSTRSGR